jgi:ribosomal protein L30/L7E
VRPEVSASGSVANIEVTVRARPTSSDAPPVSIAFRSDERTVPALQASAVTAAAIPAAGENVAMLLADFLRRMGACYALPQSTRVTQGTAPGSTVQAPQCRGLFAGDDPGAYLNSGARVGPSGNFKGMFGPTTGVVFDRPNFEFMRTNGDYVISYRWTAPDGSTDNEQLVVRKQGDRFKAIGNQYVYDSRVRSFAQWRDLVNAPSFSSISTGYNIWIANRTDAQGEPIFSKVEVTTPRGTVLTYLPSDGMGWLVRAKSDGTPSGTPVLRLAGRWVDPANASSLAQKESGLMLIDPQMPDEQLRQLPDQSVWKLEFFHRDGSPNVIQTHRTTSRALTLGEIAATVFAEITPAAREELRQISAATGRATFTDVPSAGSPSWVDLATDGPSRDFWRVPSGAVAPTSVSLFGSAPNNGPRFNDSVNVSSVARTAQIRCSPQTVADTHCDATFRDQYAVGTWVNAIELWTRSTRQVELSTMIGLYKLQ